MIRSILPAIALVSLTAAAPALAQGKDITVPASATWQHGWTGATFPPQIGAYARESVSDYSADRFNVAINYRSEGNQTFASVYLYRVGVLSLPIWADRASTALLSSDRLGTLVTDVAIIGTFTPPNGSGENSGFRLIVPLEDSGSTATGLAIFAHDDWIVKVRMTTRQGDASALDARLGEFIQGLALGQSDKRYGAFRTVQYCDEALKFTKQANRIGFDTTGTLVAGSFLGAALEKMVEDSSAADNWCRDQSTRNAYGVYRKDQDKRGFTLAFGDSGTSASIYDISSDGLTRPNRAYYPVVSNGVTEEVFLPYNRLPIPQQVFEMVENGGPMTRFDIYPGPGRKQTIMVNPR